MLTETSVQLGEACQLVDLTMGQSGAKLDLCCGAPKCLSL